MFGLFSLSPTRNSIYVTSIRNTNMDPQLNSRLCQLPIEVMCQIADYVFAGFSLRYSSGRIIRKSPEKPRCRNLLRSCRKLRQILMPGLARNTTKLIAQMPVIVTNMNARRGDEVAATQINISQAFRAGVLDLHLVAAPVRYPDYKVFRNLRRIHADLSPLWHGPDSLQHH